MKIAIICFSPLGSVWKAASMIETELTKRGREVQIIDITGNKEIPHTAVCPARDY